ncbi:MAG: beta-carotene hydroxylase [Bacteroidetes bacterium]|mgnify:CR=1 FL=1|nr:MAG: beta-carotene hydroxylase [Bacteroidota bacterium]REK04806.1 MAG: beta-carotene hydroxylase [Bacteroidota bacterium]REK36279.1 MAG: beta-carotene hydroxylase [Bacteroidota bacterium]REK51057.1 MAG: beta-carotene hydroxylase [Bacteroidota bacterium]
MNSVLLYTAVTICTFVFMECVAWFAHKYVMHGFGWFLHRDHHTRDNTGFFEKNDSFFLVFAVPAIAFFITGTFTDHTFMLYIALGITLYGMAYFLVHDIFIHQRFKIFRNTDNWYLKGIRRAHKMHHKHLDKEDGECFGMLWVPMKYFTEAREIKN